LRSQPQGLRVTQQTDIAAEAARLCSQLTPRELEVLQLSSKGLSSKVVGRHLGIGRWTIEQHKQEVFRKLGVNSTIEAAVIAAKAGLV